VDIDQHIPKLAEPRSGVHADGAAECPRDPGEGLEPGPAFALRAGNEWHQLRAGADGEQRGAARRGHLGERSGQPDHQPADAGVADQQVARVSQWKDGQIETQGERLDGAQRVKRVELDIAVGRSAGAPPGLACQRDIFSAGEARFAEGGGDRSGQGHVGRVTRHREAG